MMLRPGRSQGAVARALSGCPCVRHRRLRQRGRHRDRRRAISPLPKVVPAALAAAFLAASPVAGPALAQQARPAAPPAKPQAADKTLGAAILSASVDSGGTLVHGSGAVSARKEPLLGPNAYVVEFSRNVDVGRCALSATAIDFHADKHFVATARASGAVVAVRIFEGGTGAAGAAPFHLIVVCNR